MSKVANGTARIEVMQKLMLTLFASLFLCTGKSGIAGSNEDRLFVACPGAAAWKESHPDKSPEAAELHDKKRVISDSDLRGKLREHFDRDQIARKAYLEAPQDIGRAHRVQSIDAEDLIWLKKLISEHGIPTADQVGESGLIWIWLLVQHADRDPKFQASVLPIFVNRYEDGELDPEFVAKLTDRISLASGKHQMFGTQFDWLSGVFKPRNPADAASFKANRAKIGMMPWSDYECMMSSALKNEQATDLEVVGSP